MYAWIVERGNDGFVYNHKRSFEPETAKTTPVVYRLENHAHGVVTNLASADYQNMYAHLSYQDRPTSWYQLDDNEKEAWRNNYRVVKVKLVRV